MNIYCVRHKLDCYGVYVAAETRNKAKLYWAYEENEPFIDARCSAVMHDVDVESGYVTLEDGKRLGLAGEEV